MKMTIVGSAVWGCVASAIMLSGCGHAWLTNGTVIHDYDLEQLPADIEKHQIEPYEVNAVRADRRGEAAGMLASAGWVELEASSVPEWLDAGPPPFKTRPDARYFLLRSVKRNTVGGFQVYAHEGDVLVSYSSKFDWPPWLEKWPVIAPLPAPPKQVLIVCLPGYPFARPNRLTEADN